jgi:hypothetical protein
MHTRTLRAAFSDGGIEVRIDGDSLDPRVRTLLIDSLKKGMLAGP